jgi:uncharacterized membrane protein YeaQ/YmgE (transglycosylase-associated protein family)
MHILGFLLFGLLVGLIARAIYPGPQPMGWLATAALGMVGSLVGGLLGRAIWGGQIASRGAWTLTPGGLVSSILGAIIVLWAYLAVAGRRRRVI